MACLRVLILGTGDVASAIAHRLFQSHQCVALHTDEPPATPRRKMSFADAWWDGESVLAGVPCVRTAEQHIQPAQDAAARGFIPMLTVSLTALLGQTTWDVIVDGRMRKRATPEPMVSWAPCTIGCGPGHIAGNTCHYAIETQWGPQLGSVITSGSTAPLAGEPRAIGGHGRTRVHYSAVSGVAVQLSEVGERVALGQPVLSVTGTNAASEIVAPMSGTVRGIVHTGVSVHVNQKVVEIDPRPPEQVQVTGLGQRPIHIARGVASAIAQFEQA